VTVKVRLSRLSLVDRERIFLFLAETDRAAAYRALDLLAQGFEDIAAFPQIGRAAPRGYRCLVLRFGRGGYEIRYRLVADQALVTRIFHTREDRSS
jgi:plasmid stabilization system protein ParE